MVDPEQNVCEKHVTLIKGEIHIYLIPLLWTPPHKTTIGCVIFFSLMGLDKDRMRSRSCTGGSLPLH